MILRMMLARTVRLQPAIIDAPEVREVLREARQPIKQGIILSDSSYQKLREALK